jgi:tetratricopeptide (TPR) repeat protein
MNRTRFLFPLVAVTVAFGVALGTLALVNGGGSREPGVPAFAPAAATDSRIRMLEADVRARPSAGGLASVALTYLERARRVGGADLYPAAERLLRAALRRDPRNVDALTGMANLELARHDFAAGRRWALRARAAQPDLVRSYPPLVDAHVELGEYAAAERVLQRFVDRRPGVASYSRVSYVRELRGDLAGAAAAMRLAIVSTGDGVDGPSLRNLLGGIELLRGRADAAERAYRSALAQAPGDRGARIGLARVAFARGDTRDGLRRLRATVKPDSAWFEHAALVEAELAAGRPAAARRALASARRAFADLRAGGENTATEEALVEATYGNPRRAVVLARRGHDAAPSVRSADSLGWALTRAGRPREGLVWARRALRLGSRDPLFLYHAGTAALAAGRRGEGHAYLRRALALNPRFSPLLAPRARAALAA